jgi:hypothetical protein
MTVEDAADLAGMFDLADFGLAATWLPLAGGASSVALILDREEPGGFGGAAAFAARVPAASLPGAPRRGDRLTIGTASYAVEAADLDADGVLYRLTLSLPGPVVLVDPGDIFAPLTLTRSQASGAQATALGADGLTWGTVAADVARFDGTARRLLLEGQRIDSLRNPRAVGAVAGTPGTLPTNWLLTGLPSGISSSVVGVVAVNGVECLRLRVFGTPAGSANARLEAEPVSGIVAANGQTWTGSAFLRLFAGSQANLGLNLRMMGRDGVFTAYNLVTQAVTLNAALARAAATSVFANAAITLASSDLQLVFTAGQPVDCTFDLGWPQIEQGAFASSPILPPAGGTGATTRGADLVTVALAALGLPPTGAGTILLRVVLPQAAPAAADQVLLQLDDGSAANRILLRNPAGGSALRLTRVLQGGAAVDAPDLGTFTAGVAVRLGLSVNGLGRVAASLDGAAAQAVLAAPASGLVTLRLGNDSATTAPLNGQVADLQILGEVLSDAELAARVAAF